MEARDTVGLEEAPDLPTGVITLQPPPDTVEDQTATGIVSSLLPIVGMLGAMVFMTVNSGNTTSLLMGGGMAVTMLSMAFFNIYRQINTHRRQVDTTRREYLAYLAEMRGTVRGVARQQRRHETWLLPDPESLVFIAEEGTRVWERQRTDPHALWIRFGLGIRDLSMNLEIPEPEPLAHPDAVCLSAQSRFVATHRRADGIPLFLDLGQISHLQMTGPEDLIRGALRAIVANLVVLTAPSSVVVAVLCSEERRSDWDWLKWLPHARSGTVADALGPARMIVSSPAELVEMLGDEVAGRGPFAPRDTTTPWPHVLVILDDPPPTARSLAWLGEPGLAGATIISMPQAWTPIPSEAAVRLHLAQAGGGRATTRLVTQTADDTLGASDLLGLTEAAAVARRLMRAFTDPGTPAAGESSNPELSKDLMELLRIGDIRDFNPRQQWVPRFGRDRLRVPFGVTCPVCRVLF